MATTICLAQAKGGTGKTSASLNLSASLVKKGFKVLAIDLDQQASLTIGVGVNPLELEFTMYNLLTDPSVKVKDITIKTDEGIDVLPAKLDLATLEYTMRENIGRERALTRKLATAREEYDYIIIDTPPSLGTATLNGMAAAQWLLVPIQPEPYCLYGLDQLTQNLEIIQENSNPNLKMLGVFVSMYDARLSGHQEIAKQIRENWGELAFKTVIRRRANILQSIVEGKSVIALQENSELAKDYQALTNEVLSRV